MRWSSPPLFVALVAAPLLLASSPALAGGPDSCFLTSAQSCEYKLTSGGCEAECTPLSLVAACDAQCTGGVDVSCTGGCEATCMGQCQINPGSVSCTANCQSECSAGCSTWCSDANCTADCKADCPNRCEVECTATPPSASCSEQCTASCNASCTVKSNLSCHAACTVSLQGGCQIDCQTPTGALFCDGQYVDLNAAAQACKDYIDSLNISASAQCSHGSCTGVASVGCSVSPSVQAAGDRWALAGLTGLMMGLGLAVSRRRRRS